MIEKNKININRPTDINKVRNSIIKDDEVNFISLIKKLLLKHIDKITLVVMYFVSVHTVNVIHLLLILIFMFQIIFPNKVNYCYKVNILLFNYFILLNLLLIYLKLNILKN